MHGVAFEFLEGQDTLRCDIWDPTYVRIDEIRKTRMFFVEMGAIMETAVEKGIRELEL